MVYAYMILLLSCILCCVVRDRSHVVRDFMTADGDNIFVGCPWPTTAVLSIALGEILTNYFPASGEAVVSGVISSPPYDVPSVFIAHRVQHSHCLSIFIECC